MAFNNCVNANQTGIQTLSSSGVWSGSTVTQYGVLVGGASNTVTSTDVGTSGYILTSNGAGNNPTFQFPFSGKGFEVYFSANITSGVSNVTGDGTAYTAIFNNVVANVGSGYNNTTGVFTAPSTGKYFFCGQVGVSGLTSSHRAYYVIFSFNNGVQFFYPTILNPYACSDTVQNPGYVTGFFSLTFQMNATNTVRVQPVVFGGTKVVDIPSDIVISSFSGFKFGA